MKQLTQRAGAHFLMDLGQFAQENRSSVANDLEELPQGPFDTPRRFEQQERHTGSRGTGDQSQALPSLPRQESEGKERTVDQP
jgi:hypothetical protein